MICYPQTTFQTSQARGIPVRGEHSSDAPRWPLELSRGGLKRGSGVKLDTGPRKENYRAFPYGVTWSKTGNLHSADPRTSAVWGAVRIGGATGIQQKVAFSLPLLSEIIRLWLTLLDREHESRENHGTQNSRCKPSCLTVTGLRVRHEISVSNISCIWTNCIVPFSVERVGTNIYFFNLFV